MNRRRSGNRQLVWMVLVLVLSAGLTSVFLPVSHAGWQEVLGIGGNIDSVQLAPPQAKACTYPLAYWVFHGDRIPEADYPAGAETYDLVTTRAILSTPPEAEYSRVLAQQVLLTRINIHNQTDPAPVADTLARADAWLAAHPIGSELSYEQEKESYELAAALQAYNHGQVGPELCADWYVDLPAEGLPTAAPLDDTPPTAAATGTPTPTLLVLPTRTGTPTQTPTATNVPTNTPYPIRTLLAPPTASTTPRVILTLFSPSASPLPAATRTPLPTSTPPAEDCIQPPEYWRSHPQDWPETELRLGDQPLTAGEAQQILDTGHAGRLTYRLAHEYLAVQLNQAQGSLPQHFLLYLDLTHSWFERNDLARSPDPLERSLGLALVDALAAYNQQTGSCPPASPTSLPTGTAAWQPSPTATAPRPVLTSIATQPAPTPTAPMQETAPPASATPSPTQPPWRYGTLTPLPPPRH